MSETTRESFFDAARAHLARLWTEADEDDPEAVPRVAGIPVKLCEAIARSINAVTMSFRYVLPTQLLGKLVNPSLHARSSQAGSGLTGAWDARSLCLEVIVEFDRENESVLGGSPAPYLSKPLREASIAQEFTASKRHKGEYQDLILVLDWAQRHPERVEDLLRLTLANIRRRLVTVSIAYPAPNRPSFDATANVIRQFLADRTGGVRLQAVAVALFRSMGKHLALFATVKSENVNAADLQTGRVADLECLSSGGDIVFAVEVKDRELRIVDVQDKLPSIRERGVLDTLFLVKGEPSQAERAKIEQLIQQQFTSGHNIYVAEFSQFLVPILILLRDQGRRQFLIGVGKVLDEIRAGLQHRQKWRGLLESL